MRQRRAAVAAFDGVDPADVPPDAVTASASGLDPDISPEHVAIQVQRVADARGVPAADVADLVEDVTSGRDLGFIGAPHVRVLGPDLALDREFGRG
ncbi:K+-transporting ATPase, c chain [Geodermatophilus obscurus]|uniref:K+-transporting ATPase, c chain n=1 Tax=Geodermatophilus obscurus TaxID=1861 RepID=A0A1I5HFB1_9ACTN|nr:K+-transporting ATPase, c chain [Geodermatophilus obscurus]